MKTMLKFLCAAAFWIGIVVVLQCKAFANPIANIVYTLVNCDQPSHPCANFDSSNGPPPADYLNGFNQQAFKTFYESQGYQPTQDFFITISGNNSSGYVYGRVIDGGIPAFDTQFVFYQGQVLCCIRDFPYAINDLNDNNIFVGANNPSAMGYVSSTSDITPRFLIPFIPTFDAASQAILDNLFFPFDWYFLEINNHNTILAVHAGETGQGNSYLFVPTAVIPEPDSGIIITTGLLSLLLFWAWRSRFPSLASPEALS